MQKYGSKRDKALAAKGWAAKEGLSVQEAERVMDIELFLEGQMKWEADSPHHLMIFYEKFHHAADQGQKEAEWTVCRGHWQELPRIRSHPVGNTDSQFSGSDGMFKKKTIAREGPWSIPGTIGSGSDDHVYELHHQRCGDWGHLLGYSNHLSWESGPQWPWTGDSGPGAHNRRCDGLHLRSSQIPAFGW